MNLGFTFNGTHSSSFGLIMKSNSRPFLPPAKIFTETVPDRDGSYDFSSANQDGRTHYDDRVFEIVITAVDKNMRTLHAKLSKVARWLIVGDWKDLVFDDMPETKWTAKVENAGQVAYELGKAGVSTIYFRCQPFSKMLYPHRILLGSHIPLSLRVSLESVIKDGLVIGANTPNTSYTFVNRGDFYFRPTIRVSGNAVQTFVISSGDKFIGFYGESGLVSMNEIIFDFENQKIHSGYMSFLLGNFWEFAPGENVLNFYCEANPGYSIAVDFGIGGASDAFFNLGVNPGLKFINEAVIQRG